MPFGGWFDDYYEQIYLPAIQSSGLVAKRADDLFRPSAIVHDIWELTKQAKVVLAELSGRNPNVFYELGLAHALAKPAILVAQTMEDVPFDLRALRVIVYDRNKPDWGAALKADIEESIRETLASPERSVLPSFLQVDDSHKPSVTTTEKELISLRQDVDSLKRELATGKESSAWALYQTSTLRDIARSFTPSPPTGIGLSPGLVAEVVRAGNADPVKKDPESPVTSKATHPPFD